MLQFQSEMVLFIDIALRWSARIEYTISYRHITPLGWRNVLKKVLETRRIR